MLRLHKKHSDVTSEGILRENARSQCLDEYFSQIITCICFSLNSSCFEGEPSHSRKLSACNTWNPKGRIRHLYASYRLLVYLSTSVLVFSVKAAKLSVCSVCCSHFCSLGYQLLNAVYVTVQAHVQHIFVFLYVQKQASRTTAERHQKVTVWVSVFPSHPAWNSLLTW